MSAGRRRPTRRSTYTSSPAALLWPMMPAAAMTTPHQGISPEVGCRFEHDGGCHDHPASACACCGRPGAVVTEADPRHSVTYCSRCHAELLAVRAVGALPLRYLQGEAEPVIIALAPTA